MSKKTLGRNVRLFILMKIINMKSITLALTNALLEASSNSDNDQDLRNNLKIEMKVRNLIKDDIFREKN